MTHPISRYPVPELEDLPADIRDKILQVQEKAGFVPNVFITLAHRPDEFRAFFAYHDALMLREASSLTKAEREMIVVATSGVNHCLYCVIAHGAILRIYAKNPQIADQVAVDHRKADITPRQRAMLDFAVKLTESPASIEESDRQALRTAGWTDRDIWDIAAVAGFYNMSNRIASATDMKPNREYHYLARAEPQPNA